MAGAGSHSSDELTNDGPLDLPCVLCPNSPFPPATVSQRCTAVVRRILIEAFMQGGKGCWGQVYSGQIIEADGLPPDDGRNLRVVVKLVDPLYFEPGDYDDWEEDPEAPVRAALEACQNEVSAYAALVGVPVVPKWFGSYHVRRVLGQAEGL